jgi:hypothetical protein
MAKYRVPERISEQDFVTKTKASFIPGNHLSGVKAYGGTDGLLLETYSLRTVGHILATSQVPGSAGNQVNVINYTEEPLVCLDKYNRVHVIPPCPPEYDGHLPHRGVLIEVVSSKAVQHGNTATRAYKRYQQVPSLQDSDISKYYYENPRSSDTQKQQSNQIHQFLIGDFNEVINELGGAIYDPHSDMVLMTIQVAEDYDLPLVIHPNTSVETLIALGLDITIQQAITHQIYVNGMDSNNIFINIGGDVTRIPNCHNPNEPTGIFIRKRALARGGKVKDISCDHYAFGDPSCPLHLFDSAAAAKTYGNPDKAVELEIQKSKLETEHTKTKLAEATQALNLEKTRNDQILEQARIENEKRKNEDQFLKDKEMTEAKHQEQIRITEMNRQKAIAEEEKIRKAREEAEFTHKAKMEEQIRGHRARMMELGGKLLVAVIGIATTAITLYKLKTA